MKCVRRIGTGLVTLLLLGVGTPVLADLESAKESYQRREYGLAMAEFLPLAEAGDADAQVYVGLMYATGRGVGKDLLTAARWYRLAADQGHRDAQFNLGLMYAKGLGVPTNYAAAVRLYRDAAEQHHAAAQLNLGVCYSRGYGVLRDEAIAAQWFERAAEQGNAAAQFNLGLMYAEGRGVPADLTAAAEWYRMAAEQGHTAAQLNLGVCFERGLGVPRDLEAAATWYRLAAADGDTDARFNLARLEGVREAERATDTDAVALAPAVSAPPPAIQEQPVPPIGEAAVVEPGAEDVAVVGVSVGDEPATDEGVGEIVKQVDSVVGRVDEVVGGRDAQAAEGAAEPRLAATVVAENSAAPDEAARAWRNRGRLPRAIDGESTVP